MNKTCTASGVDWTCDRPAEKGRTLCPGHRGQHREGRELTPLRAYIRHEPEPPKQPMTREQELERLIRKQRRDSTLRADPQRIGRARTYSADGRWSNNESYADPYNINSGAPVAQTRNPGRASSLNGDSPIPRGVPGKNSEQKFYVAGPRAKHGAAAGVAEWGKPFHETPTLAELEQEDEEPMRGARPKTDDEGWASAQDAIVSDEVPAKLQALGRLVREVPLQHSDPEAEEQPGRTGRPLRGNTTPEAAG